MSELSRNGGSPVARPSAVELPECGFIREYVECFEPTTEAPREYHVAMALALLSMAVGRSAWVELAGRLHLNLYLLILGPSTEVRKSTALRYGVRTLRRAVELRPDVFESDWILPSGTVSPEALIERLSESERGLLILDEFGRLLAGARHKPYMADLKEVITEVYGGWTPGRLTRGNKIDGGPCFLTLAAATTRSRFEEEVTAEDVASGFLGRFLIVYAHGTDKLLPFPPSPDEKLVAGVVESLARVAERAKGEITFSEPARAAITEWYEGHRRGLAAQEDAELALPIFFRLDGTVRKLAALMELADDPRSNLVVSERSALDAIAYADFVLSQIRRRLLDGVLGELARKLRRLREVIEAQSGIRKAALMKTTNLPDPEFSRLTELLSAEGEVEIRTGLGQNKRGIGYWPGNHNE